MAIIDYEIIGTSNFLRAAEYRSHISGFLKEFESKFSLAKNVLIHFEESINPNPNKPTPSELVISDDGENIKLVYKTSRFFLPKGGMTQPTAEDFFTGLRYYLEHTVIAGDLNKNEQLNKGKEE